MKRELSPSKATALDTAIMTLPFAGMRSVKDTPPDGLVKLDITKLDGMTADQIIELARKTVSVKIRVGPPLRGLSGLGPHGAVISIGKPNSIETPHAHSGSDPSSGRKHLLKGFRDDAVSMWPKSEQEAILERL
jgi:hypothetical protein